MDKSEFVIIEKIPDNIGYPLFYPTKSKFDILETIYYTILRYIDISRLKVKYIYQKLFAKYHVANEDIWSLDSTITTFAWPLITRFVEEQRVGNPIFDEKDLESLSIELACEKNAEIVWNNILKEIKFAFDYNHYNNIGEEAFIKITGYDFYKKYYNEEVYDKKESNKHTLYHYYTHSNNHNEHLSRWSSSNERLDDKVLKEKETKLYAIEYYYRNFVLEKIAYARAQHGFELFGKFYMNLWD